MQVLFLRLGRLEGAKKEYKTHSNMHTKTRRKNVYKFKPFLEVVKKSTLFGNCEKSQIFNS